jgi:hypothetical protein
MAIDNALVLIRGRGSDAFLLLFTPQLSEAGLLWRRFLPRRHSNEFCFKNASKQVLAVVLKERTKGLLPLHINGGGDQVREINASWTSRDGGKHMKCTRDCSMSEMLA